MDHIFARWSLLRLAVTMGWCDGDGERTAHRLKQETLSWLQSRKASAAEADDLADEFNDFLTDNFNCIAEDGSPREVAQLVVALYQQCAAGDMTLATEILAQPLPQQPVTEYCTGAPEPEEFDGDEMSDDDDGDPHGGVGAEMAHQAVLESHGGGSGFVGGGGGASDLGSDGGMDEVAPILSPVGDGWTTVAHPRAVRKTRS
jgi:hypothetical protein